METKKNKLDEAFRCLNEGNARLWEAERAIWREGVPSEDCALKRLAERLELIRKTTEALTTEACILIGKAEYEAGAASPASD